MDDGPFKKYRLGKVSSNKNLHMLVVYSPSKRSNDPGQMFKESIEGRIRMMQEAEK